ncbi:MAG: MATE family efflux transporter [Clostridia bacterium]|nr:MATE family efflux transporter [Clostridia bacterium]
MTKKKYEVDLTEGSLFGKILAFAIPMMLSSILQSLYNAADIIVVGRFAGPQPLAAVGATGVLIGLFVNLFIALSVGTSVTVSVAIGAKNKERIHRLVHTSIALSLFCGVLITVVGILGSRTMLVWMDTPAEIMDMAVKYMQIYFAGSIFSLFYNFGAAVLRAAGDSRRPLYFLAVSGALNVGLNLFFVIKLGMAADGVALATVASQFLSALLVLITLLRTPGDCRFSFRHMRFYRKETLDILKTGLPAGIQSVVFNISNSLIQKAVNSFDTLAIAGNTAAGNLDGFVYTAMYSMHATAVTAVGQNVGAKKYRSINKIVGICLLLVTLIGLAVGGLLLLFAEPLLSLYLPDTPEAIEYALIRMSITTATYFLCGWMDTIVGCSRGMGNTLVPMIVSIVGVCGIRLGWLYTVFAAIPTMQMLYFSYTASWAVTAVLQLCLFIWLKRRLVRRAAPAQESPQNTT